MEKRYVRPCLITVLLLLFFTQAQASSAPPKQTGKGDVLPLRPTRGSIVLYLEANDGTRKPLPPFGPSSPTIAEENTVVFKFGLWNPTSDIQSQLPWSKYASCLEEFRIIVEDLQEFSKEASKTNFVEKPPTINLSERYGDRVHNILRFLSKPGEKIPKKAPSLSSLMVKLIGKANSDLENIQKKAPNIDINLTVEALKLESGVLSRSISVPEYGGGESSRNPLSKPISMPIRMHRKQVLEGREAAQSLNNDFDSYHSLKSELATIKDSLARALRAVLDSNKPQTDKAGSNSLSSRRSTLVLGEQLELFDFKPKLEELDKVVEGKDVPLRSWLEQLNFAIDIHRGLSDSFGESGEKPLRAPEAPTFELPDIMLDLRAAGVKRRDAVSIEVKLSPKDIGSNPQEIYLYSLEIVRKGIFAQLSADAIFTKPLKTLGKGKFATGFAIVEEWQFSTGKRKEGLWDILGFGVGFHVASLNHGDETTEIGLGLNASFLTSRIRFGVGYNVSLPTDNEYFFIGISLMRHLPKGQR